MLSQTAFIFYLFFFIFYLCRQHFVSYTCIYVAVKMWTLDTLSYNNRPIPNLLFFTQIVGFDFMPALEDTVMIRDRHLKQNVEENTVLGKYSCFKPVWKVCLWRVTLKPCWTNRYLFSKLDTREWTMFHLSSHALLDHCQSKLLIHSA